MRWSMTASAAEVLRVLPPELMAAATVRGSRIEGERAGERWQLELSPGPALRLGALELEVTELTIRLRGFTTVQRDAFLARLEQCCRRGGG